MSESEQLERSEIRRLKFDGTINLGHVLTAGSMLLGGFLVWSQSMVVQAKQDVRINVVEQSVIEQRAALRQLADTQQIAMRTSDRLSTAIEYLSQRPKQ